MSEHEGQVTPQGEAFYRRFVERLGLRFFFYRHDTEGTFTYLSPSITTVLGYTPDEFKTHYSAFLTDHPLNKEADACTARSIQGIKQPPFRLEIFHKNGGFRWLEVEEHPVEDAGGRVVAVEGVAQDITDRVAADATLRESEERFRKIIDFSPLSMAIVGMDGRIEYINRCAVETFGYAPEDIPDMDRWWVQAYPDPDYRAEVIATWTGLVERALAENREIEGRDYRVTCKDRTVKEMFIFGIPVAGKVFVMFQDVTARIRAEQALRENERLLRTLSDNLADTMIYQINTGPDGATRTFTYVSGAVERMHGVTTAHVLSNPSAIYDQVIEEDRKRVAEEEAEAVRNRSVFRSDLRMRMPSGEIRWRQFISTSRREPDGSLSWDGIEIDITDQKRQEEERARLLEMEQEARREAEAAVRVRDEFLSIASHDLKTPLSALQIQVEQMEKASRERKLQPEKIEAGLTLVGRQTRRLIRLVRGLLELSRITAGQFALRIAPCNLGELAVEVVERMGPELERAGCPLDVTTAPEVTGAWDADRLEQIVENLLANAIKFAPGRPIRLEVFAVDRCARLVVADRGIGIPKDQEERIFAPFERGGVSTHYGGMGMGLYIARQIAQAHGGTLTVTSAHGEGSVFTLELPLEDPEGRPGGP